MKSVKGQKRTNNNSIVSPEGQTFLTVLHCNKKDRFYVKILTSAKNWKEMSTKRLLGGTVFEAQIHSHHRECKNVQKPVLTNVNMQRNSLPYFQMFAFSFFGGSFICRFLPIFCPLASLGIVISFLKLCYMIDNQLLIFADVIFCVGK